MSTPNTSHLAEVAFTRNPANDAVPQSSSKIDASSHEILDGVTSASVTVDGSSTTVSELGEEATRRLLGRTDATLDLDLNLDLRVSTHANLLKDAKEETPYSVVVDFNQDNSPSDRFGVAFVAKVESFDGNSDDGASTASVSFSLANGAEPLRKLITGSFTAKTSITPIASLNAQLEVTGDPIDLGTGSANAVAMDDTGDGKTFEVSDTDKDIWDPTKEVQVFVNGSEVTSGYTEQYLLGRVVFDNDQTGNTVTATFDYLPKYTTEDATNFSFTADGSLQETTRLNDAGMRMTQSQYDFTANFDSYELGGDTIDAGGTEDKFITLVRDGRRIVLNLIADTRESDDVAPKLRSIGRFNTEDTDSSQDDISTASYNFEASQFNKNSSNLAEHELYRFIDE